ncbi:MAG TPA: hypothetical protein VFS21_37545 [Roseiflexaceae bacterium]|nr:hypothetical protein [Roseiflexaceae bacterium]
MSEIPGVSAIPAVVRAWAALVERCAYQRAHGLEGREVSGREGQSTVLTRHLRAAEAGQDGLLTLLLRPAVSPSTTLGGELDRFVTCLRTLVLCSYERRDFLLTYHSRHVELAMIAAQALRDAALLLLIWTLDDGAVDIALSLEHDDHGWAVVRLESRHPGIATLPEQHERVRTIVELLAPLGGLLERRKTDHQTWEVLLTLPAEVRPC